MRVAHIPSLWPNWIRRLTTNQKIGGSSPSRDIFYFLPAINQWKHALRVTGRSYHAWMPEWSKGADLRSAGQFVRLGSNPSPGSIWGISSIGRVRALQARGTGIETPMLHFATRGFARRARGWPRGRAFALVAQLVEHGSNKPRVGGSSPSWSITITFTFGTVLPPQGRIANSRFCSKLW